MKTAEGVPLPDCWGGPFALLLAGYEQIDFFTASGQIQYEENDFKTTS